VEHGADKLLISVSWANAPAKFKRRRKPLIEVFAPSGRKVRSNDWGVEITERADYAIVEILRPPPGRWLICPQGPSEPHTAAAFVKSPLKVRVLQERDKKKPRLFATASFEDRPLRLRSGHVQMRILPSPPVSWVRKQRKAGSNWSDQLKPKDLATMPRAKFEAAGHKPLEMLRGQNSYGAVAGGIIANLPTGPYNLKLRIDGTLPAGQPFKRVVLRTVGVQ
jgi:hypothetical protein